MKKPKILVVDDDPEIRRSLPAFLKIVIDCDITVKDNGSDAIQALDKEKFDVIIEDLQMPGVDGFTVLNHAIKRCPGIIKIVLTGLSDPAVTKKIESMGAVYVSKPPELKVIELVIKKAFKETA
ncbi:MAG: response regulator [Candidatus Omnitrophica bacterium]|nr:response regulator [Candidatus Omnitrophota bacterium]